MMWMVNLFSVSCPFFFFLFPCFFFFYLSLQIFFFFPLAFSTIRFFFSFT